MAASEAIHRDRVVAVINGKGGVLKTTLTANIGGLLAHSGYHVLLGTSTHRETWPKTLATRKHLPMTRGRP
ncbi:ParA family protein [Gordonia hongkongensis]|uniref:ParA family protein n=1 Tax=Gordonia hongkongensis TaxID=1701090 RepID=UPI0023431F14|nr:AAA family ATPase [Gordonia hongkongensis]